jgi:hypothetical protein
MRNSIFNIIDLNEARLRRPRSLPDVYIDGEQQLGAGYMAKGEAIVVSSLPEGRWVLGVEDGNFVLFPTADC